MRPMPQVLIPWNPAEAITVAQAAAIARKSARTVRDWAAQYDIGRRVVGEDWMLSRVALLMLLEGDRASLAAYLAGDRESQTVTDHFRRAKVELGDGPS